MSVIDSSGSSGYQQPHARPAPPPVGPPWYNTSATTGGGSSSQSCPPCQPPSPIPSMPYSGLVPPARVPHVVRSAAASGSQTHGHPHGHSLPPPAAPPPPRPGSSSAGVSREASAAQEAVLWPYRGHCARFHNFCYYFLQIFFIGTALCGGALVLADVLFRERWPHVSGLLFIGVLLVFVSAVMLFVLCQRGAGTGIRTHAATADAAAKFCSGRPPESIPLRDVAAVYVQPGQLATLRRHRPAHELYSQQQQHEQQLVMGAESEYSHPWDQLTAVNSRHDASEEYSVGTHNSHYTPAHATNPRRWQ